LTVDEALGSCRLAAREARALLAAASGFSDAALVARPERPLSEAVVSRFLAMAERRSRGEPMAYILGRKEFYGLELAVSADVLIPRPETELLVELILERAPRSVLDMGTGSGAVALAIKRHLAGARVVAVEASERALAVARQNAVTHGLEVEFRLGRWFEPLAGECFQAIVANPPYIAADDPHLAELRYEPSAALVAGTSGLEAIREVVRGAPSCLLPGGWLLLEHGLGQAGAVQALLMDSGFLDVATWPDLAGIARVTGGELKS
jgi:release factor glutamine methyltransferase